MGRPVKALPGRARVDKGLAVRAVPEDRYVPLDALVQDWLRDLRVLGRSPQTIRWYEQKMVWFLKQTGLETLDELGAAELNGYLASLQERGLADNTVHGTFETIKAFANWAAREEYPVEAALLRQRGPKVAQKEMEVYSAAQINAIFAAMPAGWPRTELPEGQAGQVGEVPPGADKPAVRSLPKAAPIWPDRIDLYTPINVRNGSNWHLTPNSTGPTIPIAAPKTESYH